MASNNDGGIRNFDLEYFQRTKPFQFPWLVNNSSLSPDGKQLVIARDNVDGLLVDYITRKTIAPLGGHLEFSFALAWYPNGYVFVKENQDKTYRV
ncbi:hypothetical protein GIB67_012701 [Kingdonia uniflora]|uniref:Uncharacterized protein n=1 Tax=Kingdonia uniflora TaxID=39325 RepID=A0A7J7NFK4_9MAGN|nr:hypothetical protein GIB67_012701 [Kingdonia uniflora]